MISRSLALSLSLSLLFTLTACNNDTSCPAGTVGCACRNGECDTQANGASATCMLGICRDCERGRDACACLADDTCLPGLACTGGVCGYAPGAVKPPTDPQCYTPCQTGLARDDGTFVPCSADGLLAGCVGGASCVNGSCIVAGSAPVTCASDVECPDFQTCIGGSCYSNCAMDTDCQTGTACYRQVCRVPCTTATASCGDGTFCSTDDGVSGYCMPLAAPQGPAQTEVTGTFTVNNETLDFSNVHVADTLVITNNGPANAEFKVRKVEHTEFSAEGSTVITDNPLAWMTLGAPGSLTQTQEYSVRIDGDGAQATVGVGNAYNSTMTRWEGVIEVSAEKMGVRRIALEYLGKPEGQWSGKLYHFANFPDDGLAAWVADKTNTSKLVNVGNAFIHRWVTFKQGGISYDELKAVIDTTVNETWKWPLMKQYCPDPDKACYPYNNPQGYSVYSDPLTQYPIPSATNELPVAFNLREDPVAGSPAVLSGKIVSASALQYAGNPAVELRFTQDPATCAPNAGGVVVCQIQSLDADIFVGGRYVTSGNDTACAKAAAGTFELQRTPWLLPGFKGGTELDASGLRYRYECRDKLLPYGSDAAVQALNTTFAGSNPIPDGRTRKRKIELVDGTLINASDIVILFRESFESFLGSSDSAGFSSYGLMVLKREVAQLDDAAYTGASPVDARPAPAGVLNVGCSPALLQTVLGSPDFPTGPTADAQINQLAGAIVDGKIPGPDPTPISATDAAKVHYFCEDTGLFDAGKLNIDPTSNKVVYVPCPVGSKVRYFVIDNQNDAAIAALTCQAPYRVAADGTVTKGTCIDTLNGWQLQSPAGFVLDPVWRCTNPDKVYCSDDLTNLRAGKSFYLPNEAAAVFVPLRVDVDNAFRYKTRFRNRQGKSVGFAPQLCVPNSDSIPYCYDPEAIEAVKDRVDCAIALYTNHWSSLDYLTTRPALQEYLKVNFAFDQQTDPDTNVTTVYDGFERLNAELLIMMGDEAYTAAFASRFDLAGSSMRSFEGSLFEPSGINLSGGAGFEMFHLYEAVQYYQSTLDRFYSLSPLLWDSIDSLGADNGFISTDTAVTYFDRLIRASSQKSRAWSEVAKRYQGFNRPDLARLVIERAYTSAYLESVVLSRMMLKLEAIIQPEDRPQLVDRIQLAALVYRSALLSMRDAYAAVSDNPTLFGFMPSYIPFPAMDDGDVNAFEKMMASAETKLQAAADKEAAALDQNRAYETDAAVFESELVSIRNDYENRLAEICGTFTGDDGRVYPAIPKYAYLNERVALIGNPCGHVGNGELHQAMGDIEVAGLDLQLVVQSFDNILKQIDIERDRVSAQCQEILNLANFKMGIEGTITGLNTTIRATKTIVDTAKRINALVENTAKEARCIVIAGTSAGTDCPSALAATAAITVAAAVLEGISIAADIAIAAMETAIDGLQLTEMYWETTHECEYAKIDSVATVKNLVLGFKSAELEMVKQGYVVKQANAAAQALRNEATRVIAEQEETEQLTINIAAAQNDPNVRIYKNDSIIAADRTFHAALREAYRATKIYEYYTSQSYAHLGDLFLVRMAVYGDMSLEAYLAALSDAFYEFEEQYGNPDTRVAVVSLRDDVLAVPRLGEDGSTLTEADRLERFHKELLDVARLDERGYLTLPFATNFNVLSPLTSVHKILSVQVEIIGSDVGDSLGRVYLQQSGTGVVRRLDGDKSYFGFPARTAVVNPFFNGEKQFDDTVYTNARLRDRPLVNTHWELVINQKDELVNKDINLSSLTDVRLYVSYSDFTNL